MRASVRRMLQIATRRRGAIEHEGFIGKLPSMPRRHAWSRKVDRLLDAASRNLPLGGSRIPTSRPRC